MATFYAVMRRIVHIAANLYFIDVLGTAMFVRVGWIILYVNDIVHYRNCLIVSAVL